ncbi:MAG: ABC transporter permease subunit [Opitutales bacterium]|nr:ABC transporter permease subunit [Opitutales bacterium]
MIKTNSRFTSLIITILVIIFMYLPIVMLISMSFNASRYGGAWTGFSFKWYVALFKDHSVINATMNTLFVALVATFFSTIIGTLAAWVLNAYKRSNTQKMHYALIYAPLVIPDVLMGISLLLMFVSLKINLGLATVIMAHITFCVSFVAFTVLARLQDFDFNLIQAAQDLGASSTRIFIKIILPLLLPGIVAGAMMAFTLSMDDFVVTFFVGGPGSTTLPVKVYSMMKHGPPAIINALSVVFMAVTFTVAIIGNLLTRKKTA